MVWETRSIILTEAYVCIKCNALHHIGKCKLFRIKHITLLEGETFLRNKHEIAFFEIKCTFFAKKENTIRKYSKLFSSDLKAMIDTIGFTLLLLNEVIEPNFRIHLVFIKFHELNMYVRFSHYFTVILVHMSVIHVDIISHFGLSVCF